MKDFKKLSFIIPAYNEGKTLAELVEKVILLKLTQNIKKEILIVNDGSKDNTWDIIKNLEKKYPEIKGINNDKNMGKSQTVRNGILHSTGDYIVIQDADLEYEPQDINIMINKCLENGCDVVYGNRFGKKNKVIYLQNYIGNKSLSFISNLFTYPRIKTWLPDMEVCYKLIRGDVARELGKGLVAKSNFGFEPEITTKLSKYKINEKHLKYAVIPIHYYPRSVAEGKKMKAVRDGLKALIEIIKYNFSK